MKEMAAVPLASWEIPPIQFGCGRIGVPSCTLHFLEAGAVVECTRPRSLSMRMRQSVSEFSVERCVFMIDSPCSPTPGAVD